MPEEEKEVFKRMRREEAAGYKHDLAAWARENPEEAEELAAREDEVKRLKIELKSLWPEEENDS